MFVRIRYRQTLEFVGSPNLPPRSPNFGIQLLDSKADDCRQILAKQAGIQLVPKSGTGSATSGIVAGCLSGCHLLRNLAYKAGI
jgi:hypothetical protein